MKIWYVLALMWIGSFLSFSQQLDTLAFPAGQHGKIDIFHTTFLREQLFPFWEVSLSPCDVRMMNNFYLGHSEDVKLRFKNMLLKVDFSGMYGNNFVSTSLRSYIKPNYAGGVYAGYYALHEERKWKGKIPVFVGSSKKGRGIRRKVIGEKRKMFMIGPIGGVSFIRYDSNILAYDTLGTALVAGNATISSISAGLVVDMATGFTTKSNGKTHSLFRRSSFHMNVTYGVIGEFDIYKAFAGNAESTEPKLDGSSFAGLKFQRFGWNADYTYSFGSAIRSVFFCGVYVAKLPRQSGRTISNFKISRENYFGSDFALGMRIGYSFRSK